MKYTEFTSEASGAGLKTLAPPHNMDTWTRTNLFHVYAATEIPSILQTPEYRCAMAQFWSEYYGVPSNLDEAAAITQARRSVLEDGIHQFVFVIDEHVLQHQIDGNLTMMGQIDSLYKDSHRPNVAIGVLPQSKPRALLPSAGFWVFDRKSVAVEIPNASIEITDAPQVHLYVEMFASLSLAAQFDRERW